MKHHFVRAITWAVLLLSGCSANHIKFEPYAAQVLDGRPRGAGPVVYIHEVPDLSHRERNSRSVADQLSDNVSKLCAQELPSESDMRTMFLSELQNRVGVKGARSPIDADLVVQARVIETYCGAGDSDAVQYSTPLLLYGYRAEQVPIFVRLDVQLIAPQSGQIIEAFQAVGVFNEQYSGHGFWGMAFKMESRRHLELNAALREAFGATSRELARLMGVKG